MGRLLSFQLLGFPVSIHGSFLLLIGFIGLAWFPEELEGAAGFAVIALVSILVHELGHAVVARSQGVVGTPSIALAGMGGATTYRLADEPSRLQAILISAAGPAAGIALGGLVLALRASDVIESGTLAASLVTVGLFTTFGWSAFNLLPIVPLDGGHIMTDLLPGSPLVRRRRAAAVSIGVAILVGVWLYLAIRALIAPLILGLFAYQNYRLLRAIGPAPQPPLSATPEPPTES